MSERRDIAIVIHGDARELLAAYKQIDTSGVKLTEDQKRQWDSVGQKIEGLEGSTRRLATTQRSIFDGLGKRALRTGLAIAGITTAALAARSALAATARETLQFETGMAEVNTIIDVSDQRFQQLGGTIVGMSQRLPIATNLLTKGLYQTISAGITDTAKATDLLDTASRLAIAGVSDVFTSVDVLTTIINAYGLETENAAHVSDLLFKTVELGKTNLNELGPTIGRVIPLSAELGISLEELFASVATLTAGGLKTDQAITSLRGIFNALIAPQEAAKKAAADMNIEWGKQAIQANGLIGTLQIMKEATQGNSELVKALVPDVEALTGALALTGSQSDDLVEKFEGLQDAHGAMITAFEKQRTGANAIIVLQNNLKALAKTAGDAVLPVLADLAEGISAALAPPELDNQARAIGRQFEFQFLTNQLRNLREQSSLTKGEQEQLREAIDKLRDQFPEFAEDLDLQKTRWTDLAEEITKANRALEEQIQTAALRDAYQEEFEQAAATQRKINENNEAIAAGAAQVEALHQLRVRVVSEMGRILNQMDSAATRTEGLEALRALKTEYRQLLSAIGLEDQNLLFVANPQGLREKINQTVEALEAEVAGAVGSNARLKIELQERLDALEGFRESLGDLFEDTKPDESSGGSDGGSESVGVGLQEAADVELEVVRRVLRAGLAERRGNLAEQEEYLDSVTALYSDHLGVMSLIADEKNRVLLEADRDYYEEQEQADKEAKAAQVAREQAMAALVLQTSSQMGEALQGIWEGNREGYKDALVAMLRTLAQAVKMELIGAHVSSIAKAIISGNWLEVGTKLPQLLLAEGLFAGFNAGINRIFAFGEGGRVTGPTLGLFGEKGQPEWAIPEYTFEQAMERQLVPKLMLKAAQHYEDPKSHKLLQGMQKRLDQMDARLAGLARATGKETALAFSNASRGRL